MKVHRLSGRRNSLSSNAKCKDEPAKQIQKTHPSSQISNLDLFDMLMSRTSRPDSQLLAVPDLLDKLSQQLVDLVGLIKHCAVARVLYDFRTHARYEFFSSFHNTVWIHKKLMLPENQQ